MSNEIHKLLYERASRSQYLIKHEEDDDGDDERREFIGFDETGQFGNILETMPTDWLTVDMWSQLVKFDIDTHVKGCLVLGLFVLNRPPDPAEDELIYDTETVFTTHGIMRLLDVGRIQYHYIDYVIVAPK